MPIGEFKRLNPHLNCENLPRKAIACIKELSPELNNDKAQTSHPTPSPTPAIVEGHTKHERMRPIDCSRYIDFVSPSISWPFSTLKLTNL